LSGQAISGRALTDNDENFVISDHQFRGT